MEQRRRKEEDRKFLSRQTLLAKIKKDKLIREKLMHPFGKDQKKIDMVMLPGYNSTALKVSPLGIQMRTMDGMPYY